ncbi:Transposase [Cordylochernes scorpioides]|uniref:Transposase n=1 Tax=Cordylochernes scorpioides TaxID=51811 RepID=A0ABY6K707_9ARAC|nr:Transposase [Cordylochernes scorpioides]
MPGHRKRRQFKQTDAFTRGMVIGLKRAGWSIRQIAADTHLGASTVHRLWRRWLEQGNVAIYRNAGATRVTSARVDRRILRQAVAAPQATCTAILQHVQDTLDHSISTRTISRRLVANGLHSCRPLRRLPLTPPNRRQRLEWCRARSTWMTEWHRVVFSDESRFCLSSDSRRVRVWRRRGERSKPAAIVERPTVRERGIMVWGAIAYDSRSPLLRIQGTMMGQRYVDDVLRPVTLPYLQGVPNALYQQDNARPHTARISQQALQHVQMLPWPPYSPDLSPIEHVWDIIGRRLHALPQPRSEDELWQMVEREWRVIPQDAIRTLIDSLPRRVAACIARCHGDIPMWEEEDSFRQICGDRRQVGYGKWTPGVWPYGLTGKTVTWKIPLVADNEDIYWSFIDAMASRNFLWCEFWMPLSNVSYIGETGRFLGTSLQEHKSSWKYAKERFSMVEHGLRSGHQPDWENTSTIYRGIQNSHQRKFLEAIASMKDPASGRLVHTSNRTDTHLGASTVHRLWRRWLEQGNVAIYRNVGATRVTSARVDRRILRQAVAAPQATCTAILQHVQDTLDHSISTRTISRRLVANGLHSCHPLRRLPLTPPNSGQRLEWCRARSTWMTEWHRVVFSDESRFCLSSDSRRVRVWRRRGERSNPAAIVERPTVRQRGIMVWGAIAYDSRSPLLRIHVTMTAQRYVDDVLRPVTLPYLQGVPNALYQQDNARPHTARISQQALQDVQMLPWPPYSPDLSPIEHVWDIIGRRLHALPQPRSEDELWQMVEREWRAIPQDAIRTLIDSLPRRVAACIAVRGGPTCY